MAEALWTVASLTGIQGSNGEREEDEMFVICDITSIRITDRGEKFGQCRREVARFEVVTRKGKLLMKPTHGTDGYLP